MDRTVVSQKLIIDGYNVIYSDEALRRTACKDLERARAKLVSKIKEYLARRRVQVTLVFDGCGGFEDAEVIIPGKLQVLYSSGVQTADDVIISTLKNSGNPTAYIVVTSDMADIGRTAKGLGCDVIGSKRFLDRMVDEGRCGSNGPAGKLDGKQFAEMGDTDYWLEKFIGDDETEEEK